MSRPASRRSPTAGNRGQGSKWIWPRKAPPPERCEHTECGSGRCIYQRKPRKARKAA
jgi:hypothetical protein